MKKNAAFRLALVALLALVLGLPAQAQSGEFPRYEQYARAVLPSAQVLGMGGAGVAVTGPETAFFYNPAHFTAVDGTRIELLGVRVAPSTKLFSDIDFFRDRVEPALEEGIEIPLSQDSRDLFTDALAQGVRPTVGQVGVLLPSVMVGGGSWGVGAGAFAHNTTRYRFVDDGAGVPVIDLFSQADAMGVLSGAARIPNSNLSVGLAGKYTRRFIGYKNESFLDIDPDNEQIYILDGKTVSFDLGLQYTDVFGLLPGSLDFGLAVYDVVGGAFEYQLFETIDFTGGGEVDDAEVAAIQDAFADRDGSPSFRLGAAYGVPTLPALPFVSDVDVALDYFSENTSESDQPFLSKFRFGGQAKLARFLALRAGVSQGYPTVGAGLETKFFRVNYVFYGEEDGRLPGQIERYNHLLQVRLGIF